MIVTLLIGVDGWWEEDELRMTSVTMSRSTTTPWCAAWSGPPTLWRTDVRLAASRSACHSVPNVLDMVTTKVTITTCSSLRLAELVTAEIQVWWEKVDFVAGWDRNNNNKMFTIYPDCCQHGPNARRRRPGAPAELMCVAENMLPKMILRLIQHLRDKR